MTPREPDAAPGRARSAYAAAGVDTVAADRAVELLKEHTRSTHRSEVRTDVSGFAGMFQLDLSRYRTPVLTATTDGVGTKVEIARELGRHDTIGIDLVAMVVDDLVVVGAEPLFLTDYIACGRVVPERIEQIVAGVAAGCRQAGCSLIAGETAEHPGTMEPGEYDLAGSGTGVLEADAVLGPHRVRSGDAVIAMAASGPHSNGYSLIRRVIAQAQLSLRQHHAELDAELGQALLTPTRIYARDCLALLESVEVHAFAHITGGGLAANLDRSLPAGTGAVVDRATWSPPPVFGLIAEHGGIGRTDMEATFNMGVGMTAVVPAGHAERAVTTLSERGVAAWTLGVVDDSSSGVRLVGDHARSAAMHSGPR